MAQGMNAFDRHLSSASQPAVVRYGDGEFTVLKAGGFVVCAVSGKHIPLPALKYWSVELQEPYAGPGEALQRWRERH